MATSDKLNYLLETKNQIKNAILEKGVGITDTDSFRSYANKISDIENQSGGMEDYFNTTSAQDGFDYICNRVTKKLSLNMNTSNITNMDYTFRYCKYLEELDVNQINTSNVTSMRYMFNKCESLTQLNLSNFNTNNVTDMSYMFQDCTSLTVLNLSNFNTSNVTNVREIFRNCISLNTIQGELDLRNATNINMIFAGCNNLETIYIKNLNKTGLSLSSTNISHDCLVYLVNNLVDSTGQATKSISVGYNNQGKLTNDEIAIATAKNWTISF